MKLNLTFAGALLAATALAPSAFAQVTSADIGLNPSYQQTGATTVASTGGFFSGRIFFTNASDYASGTLTWPGADSPQALGAQPGPALIYQPSSYSTLAALNAAYPVGAYSFSIGGGTQPSQTDTINYRVAADSNVAQLTAASYNAVQSAKAGQALAIDLAEAMAPSGNATSSFVFLTLYDISSGFSVAYSTVAPDISDTSFLVPGGILKAGDQYELDTNFSDRIGGTDGNGVSTTIFFDTHTDVLFTASAAPEPAAWALMLAGVAGLGGALRRRRTASAAAA